VVLAMLAAASAPFPQPSASASCAAPYLDAGEPLVLERGASVVVEGRAFTDGCQDSMSCSGGFGCDDCDYDDAPPTAYADVELLLVQRGRTWVLDTTDAESADDDHLGWVTWTFDVPDGAVPGLARLVPDHAQPVRVRIR